MRILSSFKDYYDSVQAYGFDPKLVYVRESTSLLIKFDYFNPDPNEKAYDPLTSLFNKMPRCASVDFSKGVIAFCGRAYPFYYFMDKSYFSFQDLKEAVQNYNGILHQETINWLKKKKRLGWSGWTRWGMPDLTEESWQRFCDENSFDIGDDFFIRIKAPCVSIFQQLKEAEITLNPRLYEFGFASAVDPFTAHQTLAMFIGNNMVSQMDPNPKISDELKRDSHGMDKWSFKTHKTESKKFKKKTR